MTINVLTKYYPSLITYGLHLKKLLNYPSQNKNTMQFMCYYVISVCIFLINNIYS